MNNKFKILITIAVLSIAPQLSYAADWSNVYENNDKDDKHLNDIISNKVTNSIHDLTTKQETEEQRQSRLAYERREKLFLDELNTYHTHYHHRLTNYTEKKEKFEYSIGNNWSLEVRNFRPAVEYDKPNGRVSVRLGLWDSVNGHGRGPLLMVKVTF